MKIDIHTLAFTICLTNFLQVIALSTLLRLNLKYEGISFWIAGTSAWSLAFIFNYLRDFPGIGPLAIVANNTMFVLGLLFIYAGVLRFLNRREKVGLLVAICAVVTLVAYYFTFIDDNRFIRRINFSFGVGIVSLMIANALYRYKNRSVATSAHLLWAVFISGGIFFTLRGLSPFVVPTVEALFTPSLAQLLSYLIALVMSTLWTLGFIIMVCQRSAFESREAEKTTEAVLEHEREMLQEQRNFLSTVGHEFRTPLAIIDSAATNLAAVPLCGQADLEQRAHQIQRATRSLSHLIDNCLTSERIEQGGFQVKLKVTEIARLISEATNLLHLTPFHQLCLEWDQAPEKWTLDPVLVKIVLSNLLDNAIKYSEVGKVTVRAEKRETMLILSVTNQGDVITDEEKSMLFQKFVRGTAARRIKNIRGSGLGLFISRSIARAHGGDVDVISKNGVTRFELSIPER